MGRRAQQRGDRRRIRKPVDDGWPRQRSRAVGELRTCIDRCRQGGAQGRRGQEYRSAVHRGGRPLQRVQLMPSTLRVGSVINPMRTRALLDFCSWLEQTPLSQTIQSTGWIVPAVQTVHILSMAAVMSSVLMIDLRLIGILGRDQPLARVSERFRPVIWWTLPILLVTGIVMITGEPARSLESPVFQLKMALLLAAIIVTLSYQVPLGRDSSFWDLSVIRRAAARIIAVLSLLLWTGIVFAGRWIAYYDR